MAVTKGTNKPVPLRGKLNNRFYEPIVLLSTLNREWMGPQKPKALDPSLAPIQSPENEFQDFVNKLSQICDSRRRGETVTAFVVLQFPDHIEYRFASNSRDENDLIRTQSFVERMLDTLHRASDLKSSELHSEVLQQALIFTRPRIEAYVKSLHINTVLCIESCERDRMNESEPTLKELRKLKEMLCTLDDKTLEEDSFFKQCESLLNSIDRIYQSEMKEVIREKSNEGEMHESKYWCELYHGAARLLSYQRASKRLVATRKSLPELFENFEVCFVGSSKPARCPLKPRKVGDGLSMREIIGRMTSDPEELEKYQSFAQQLEKLELDKEIQEKAWEKTLRPIVHAEILVLDSLVKDGGTNFSRFFKGYKYIGCSKPTCRLCDYYFSFHRSGIQVRQSHRNIYPNWRAPDVYDSAAAEEREALLIKILSRVKQDGFRTLLEKLPDSKRHDSNTEPTYPPGWMSTRESEVNDTLATAVKNLDISRSWDDTQFISSRRGSSDTIESLKDEENFDEDEGGAKL